MRYLSDCAIKNKFTQSQSVLHFVDFMLHEWGTAFVWNTTDVTNHADFNSYTLPRAINIPVQIKLREMPIKIDLHKISYSTTI